MGFQPGARDPHGGREEFLGRSRKVSKICIIAKIINVQVRTSFNYPHLNNFTLHFTYITYALKYIVPVLGHIVHVPKSTHVQCTRNICAMGFQPIRNDFNYMAS